MNAWVWRLRVVFADGLVFSHTLWACGFSPMSTNTTQATSREDVLGVLRRSALGPGEFTSVDERLLALVIEQVAVRSDQLERFLGLGSEELEGRLGRLAQARFVRLWAVGKDEPRWVWVTGLGCRAFGVSARRSDLALLDHRYYINEIRLHLAAVVPEGRWIGERAFRFWPVSPRGEYPDAVLELDGVRYAIEVEISGKSRRRLRELVLAKSLEYEQVVYFCTGAGLARASVLRSVSAVVADVGAPNVSVREMPCGPPRRLPAQPRGVRGPLRDREREVAVWVSEQGGARLDHLARVLLVSLDEAEAVLVSCEEAGSIGRLPGLEGEADWFWLRHRGARIAANGLHGARVPLSRFRHLAVVNGLRLRFEASGSGGRWISRRMAERGARAAGRGRAPDGVIVDSEGVCTAIYVVLTASSKGTVPMLVGRFSKQFDRLVCVGPKRALGGVAGIVEREGLVNVGFADLAGGPVEVRARRPRRLSRGRLPSSESVPDGVAALVMLCGEEGFLTVGELGRLSGFGSGELSRFLSMGVGLGLLRDDQRDALDRQVFGATSAGVRFVGLEVVAVRRPVRGIGEHQVLVQARVESAAGVEGVRWFSRRVLAGSVGRGPRLLKGLLECEGGTYAVDVQLGPVLQTRKVRERLGWILERCDGLVMYCTVAGRPGIEAMVASEGWQNVELRSVSAAIESDREAVG